MAAAKFAATFKTLFVPSEEDIEGVDSGAVSMLREDLLNADPTGRGGRISSAEHASCVVDRRRSDALCWAAAAQA